MNPFILIQPSTEQEAIGAATNGTKYIGGGTNLVDLMKMHIEQPSALIDISHLDLHKIVEQQNRSIQIGALVTNTDLAYHPLVRKRYPMLSEAILAGASPQLRNMATTAGNILQRTRCAYFYDTVTPCNKRQPGAGCSAIGGYNRMHAVLGGSAHCIATHPSDMCVAMAALDAVIHVQGVSGIRNIAFGDFHLVPGDTPHKENSLQPAELITHIEIPALSFAKNSGYVKARDRNSYEFALSSAAVALDINGRIIRAARIALGGVATKPWRAYEAERLLVGMKPGVESYEKAAAKAMEDAVPHEHNAFKIALAKRVIIKALQKIGG